MAGIPPVVDTDVEDVVWALQTAEALWKRNERGDALVWLRRAAQAAGEANDDDRALVLARDAAELTDWIAQGAAAPALAAEPPTTETPPPPDAEQARDTTPSPPPPPPDSLPEPPTPPVLPALAAPPTFSPGLSPGPTEEVKRVAVITVSQPPPSQRVLTAAELHAGMLDPWAASDSKKPPRPPPRVRTPEIHAFEDDEVITSAKPIPKKGTPAPPPAEAAAVPSAPLRPAPPARRPPPPRPVPSPPVPRDAAPSPFAPPPEAGTALKAPAVAKSPEPAGPPDLSATEAFADLPDDARTKFALAAKTCGVSRGEEAPPFALALVVAGTFEVLAVGAEGAATHVMQGAVLRSRGTLDATIPLRLVCHTETAVLATWDDEHVSTAFHSCPWVEEDLRASGDRVQALAGVTLGTLGRASYTEVLAQLAGHLTLRTLAGGETLLRAEDPVPGLTIVGAGLLELANADTVESTVKPGGFVFAAQTLAVGRAPKTARAGAGGALVMQADRSTTQELVVTQPLLLELLGSA